MAADGGARWRPGLRARLLAGTVLVAVCSITATAWLAAYSATGSLQDEQGRARADTARIYDGLLAYAATHPSWDGVGGVLADLGRRTGLRIQLTAGNRFPIAGAFGLDESALPAQPAAVLDALAVDVTLQPGAPADRIDTRAVGPFRLTPQERDELRSVVEADASCLRGRGIAAQVMTTPSGRSYVSGAEPECEQVALPGQAAKPAADRIVKPTATENLALRFLGSLLTDCLRDRSVKPYDVALTASGGLIPVAADADRQLFLQCLGTARHTLLSPYVTPAALLFVSTPPGRATVGLSAAGAARIGGAALLVLLLTVGMAVLLSGRVLAPLRTLTRAAQRMRGGDHTTRADVTARWEIAELAAAFNEMSEHLERTERQRKDLVSDVSHELRTPLGTIRGWLVAAQDGVADLDPELVASLLEETLVLQHLVDDLHELASADAGEFRLRPEPTDAGALLTQVAAAHPADLAVQADGDLTLWADPVRLRQAVGNLVVNAVRHTPEDGRITLLARRDAADVVVIEVRDTGTGITPEDLPHIFDRFWRADRSRSRATGGRGLGLAIVRHLVEAHGGTVTVASRPGAGTTFTLRLPALTKEPA